MKLSELVAIALTHGVPLAQEIFKHMWHVTADDDGHNVTWEQVLANIAAARAQAQAGIADADAEIAKQQQRLADEQAAERTAALTGDDQPPPNVAAADGTPTATRKRKAK